MRTNKDYTLIDHLSVESLADEGDYFQRLIASEHRANLLLNNSADAMVLYDQNGLVQYVNPAFMEIFGWELDELKGKRIDFVPDEAREETSSAIERMLAGEKLTTFRTKRVTKNGQKLDISLSVSRICNSQGGIIGNVVILRDETQICQTEQRLRKIEVQHRAVLEANPDPMVLYDMKGNVTYVNPAFTKIFSWELDELIDRKLDQFVPDENWPETKMMIDMVLAGKSFSGIETWRYSKHGKKIPVSVSGAIFSDVNGTPLGSIINLRDLSEREKAQIQHRAVMEANPDPMALYDMKGKVTYVNPAFTKTFGWELDELLGRKLDQFVPDENWPETKMMIDMVLAGNSFSGIETWRFTKPGNKIPVSISGAIYKDANNVPLGSVINLRDISLQISERKLKEEKKWAEEANRAKSSFLAAMSHEIRTPMNGVIGFAELLLNTPLSKEQFSYAKTIRKGADALLNIINDILDFSKIEAGKLELEEIEFDFWQVVDETIKMLSLNAFEKGLEFGCIIDTQTPKILKGDPGRLRQIIINLISNGIKFTKKGSVTLHIKVVKVKTRTIRLKFSIVDTGIGIPPDRQNLLFHSFSQVDRSTTRKFGGTGLGLAICKRLVEMMGGAIGFESIENQGTSFWFEIQLAMGAFSRDYEKKLFNELSGISVLAAGLSNINREIVGTYLEPLGCKMSFVNLGQEVLSILQRNKDNNAPFDVVVFDHIMLAKSAGNLVESLKADDNFRKLKLILVTSSAVGNDSVSLNKHCFDGILSVPLTRNDLIDQIGMAIKGDRFKHHKFRLQKKDAKPSLREKRQLFGKVLIAEDNIINQQVAQNFVKKSGCSIDIANNGKEAIDLYEGGEYDLILMDINMPDVDGVEATKLIRKLESDKSSPKYKCSIPIIALTANAMKGDSEKYLNAGMDDYLVKPFDPEHLLNVLQKWLNKKHPL